MGPGMGARPMGSGWIGGRMRQPPMANRDFLQRGALDGGRPVAVSQGSVVGEPYPVNRSKCRGMTNGLRRLGRPYRHRYNDRLHPAGDVPSDKPRMRTGAAGRKCNGSRSSTVARRRQDDTHRRRWWRRWSSALRGFLNNGGGATSALSKRPVRPVRRQRQQAGQHPQPLRAAQRCRVPSINASNVAKRRGQQIKAGVRDANKLAPGLVRQAWKQLPAVPDGGTRRHRQLQQPIDLASPVRQQGAPSRSPTSSTARCRSRNSPEGKTCNCPKTKSGRRSPHDPRDAARLRSSLGIVMKTRRIRAGVSWDIYHQINNFFGAGGGVAGTADPNNGADGWSPDGAGISIVSANGGSAQPAGVIRQVRIVRAAVRVLQAAPGGWCGRPQRQFSRW